MEDLSQKTVAPNSAPRPEQQAINPVIDPQAVQGALEVVARFETAEGRITNGIQQLAERATEFQEAVGNAQQWWVGTMERTEAGMNETATRTVGKIAARVDTIVGEATEAAQTAASEANAAAARTEEVIARMHESNYLVVREAVRSLLDENDPQILKIKREIEKPNAINHKHMPLLRAAMEANVPIYMHGEAGSGKSTAAQIAAEEYGLTFRSRVFGPTTSEAALMGYRDANGVYQSTGFRRVVEEGGVFLFDEIDNGNPGILTAMNGVLSNGRGEFPDDLVINHANARFIAAANTIGHGATAQYVGRNKLDASTLDRFAFVQWDIDWKMARALTLEDPSLQSKPVDITQGGLITTEDWFDRVERFNEAVSNAGIQHVVSPRAANYGKELIKVGVGVKWLADMLVFKGISDDKQQKLRAALARR
ncbi:MAG TPA: AAA family ATPase [Candidatus Saccharimonadales bacterium]|nr:AAA family ATPase [Candidatus Saccharimonadales bacterium]